MHATIPLVKHIITVITKKSETFLKKAKFNRSIYRQKIFYANIYGSNDGFLFKVYISFLIDNEKTVQFKNLIRLL
ncbi:hypothetical protein AC625_23280 [Peribacillus loiseleuriae]|uniref:Uncharacterized protein n=1 Tax=Peribacillus loiseleuriae TaxID=1679170 RepID=A0A0K9H0N3_9BACI|nr:hypothetical protein AC625_23280 [Peribacillus loiseleuriae]